MSIVAEPPRISSWTGGQFSLVRGVTAVVLGSQCFEALRASGSTLALGLVGVAAAACLLLGWRTRWACALGALALGGQLALAGAAPASAFPLLLTLAALGCSPSAPYGSAAARGRVDPAGGWHLARWIPNATAVALAGWLGLGAHQIDGLAASPWPVLFALAGALLLLTRRLGGSCALAGWGSCVVLLVVASLWTAPPLAWALPALLLAFDPSWLPDPSEGWVDTVFYDGSCGLCHGAVRWLLAEDPGGDRFRYAPLGGEAFLAAVPPARRALLPDSILVRTPDGSLLDRSAAVGRLLTRLGGLWGLLGLLWGVVPRSLGDLAYAAVARVRLRLAAAPSEACPLLTPDLGRRFAP
jgi:predicted DCC family thiol-disulfide oxidoreductase YuxK